MNLNHNAPVNEVGRVVIHLPEDAIFYEARSYLPVVIDQVDGMNRPALLRSGGQNLHYLAGYEIFNTVCSDRAQRTVDQALLVDGAPITPERYLTLWRAAIKGSVPINTAAREHGFDVVAILSGPRAEMAGAKATWTNCPLGSFAAFEAKYRRHFSAAGDGSFRVELDLARPDAARDASFAASMMSNALRRSSQPWRTQIELRQTRPALGQAPLFDTAGA